MPTLFYSTNAHPNNTGSRHTCPDPSGSPPSHSLIFLLYRPGACNSFLSSDAAANLVFFRPYGHYRTRQFRPTAEKLCVTFPLETTVAASIDLNTCRRRKTTVSFRLTDKDCMILESIAEHRILTVRQIAAMVQKGRQVVRRRLRDLDNEGLVKVKKGKYGRGRGMSQP